MGGEGNKLQEVDLVHNVVASRLREAWDTLDADPLVDQSVD